MTNMASRESFILNQSNFKKINEAIFAKKIQSSDYWHKFIIKNGATLDKDKLLHSVLNAVSPIDLVPVKYTISGDDSYFLARNCKTAIEKLCKDSLTIIIVLDGLLNQSLVNLNIQLCHVEVEKFHVNMKSHLIKAVEKRLKTSREGELDLSNFHKEPELNEMLFCPLSIPKFFKYILNIFKSLKKPVERINFSNNSIRSLEPLDVLNGLDSLIGLDLSNNKIEDIEGLKVISSVVPRLQEINLNGNPLCSSYSSPLQYTNVILNYLPLLQKLDGVVIDFFLPIHRNWLCNNEAENLINQFIEHYFRLYDGPRYLLEHTYHKSAIFSLMSNEKIEVKPTTDYKLKCYHDQSRNILKVNEQIKIIGHYFPNRNKIMKSLISLPPSEHDPFSFKTDVLFHENRNSVIMISGIFKDFQDKPRYRSFNRTFVLLRTAEDEYKITNDLFQINNASESEIQNSFLKPSPLKAKRKRKPIANIEERRNMVTLVSKFTDMNEKYSTKCLEDVNWDVKKGLDAFLDNYTSYKIPTEAFFD